LKNCERRACHHNSACRVEDPAIQKTGLVAELNTIVSKFRPLLAINKIPAKQRGSAFSASGSERMNLATIDATESQRIEVTIFQKIINKEIPASIVYEDDLCLAFRDVSPQAPVHVLLIPKKPVVSLNELVPEDAALCGHMILMVPKIAATLGLDGGYRTVVNTGAHGGQSVFHLHIHILGGRALSWPPG